MQNRYTADVGDFGKFGMLRELEKTGVKIGVNWYLVPNESHNEDGKYTTYFDNCIYDNCDDELRTSLSEIIQEDKRSVAQLEKRLLLKNGVYYNKMLLSPLEAEKEYRADWHNEALDKFATCDFVFLDPDNGVLPKSVSKGSGKSIKYVLEEEIIDYYERGHSIIFYNHRCREKVDVYLKRFEHLFQCHELETAYKRGLSFKRGTIRDYIHIIQPIHEQLVEGYINSLLSSPWNRHFEQLL